MLIAHLSIFICIFLVTLAIVNLIPSLFTAYQERYQANTQRTVRELDKFFLNIKPTRILIGAAVLGVVLGLLTRNWVLGLVVIVAGLQIQ